MPNYESYSFVVLLKSIILSLKQKTKPHLLVDNFKELSIYDKPIEKPKIKRLKSIDLLSEFSFFEELNIIKTNHAFRGYAMSCKVEIIERQDPIDQLETRKSSIKDFFSDLLNEAKYKSIEIEFSPVYINSTTKTVVNHRFSLESAFQDILYRIDNWVNEGSDWIVELIES